MSPWMQHLLLLPTAILALTTSYAFADLLEARTDTVIAPYSYPASEHWEGDDGTWSTFTIQVGTPAQTVRTLFSFQSYQTWAVIPQGCLTASSYSACSDSRGGLFNYSSSSSWTYQGLYYTYIEQNLGYTANAYYGYDTVTLAGNGENGPTVKNTTVGGIALDTFYLGVLGVNPKPTNFTSENDPYPSLMTQLRDNKKIASMSFGFTAGAYYRFANGVYASLTLGGYDTSKYSDNNVTFNFGADNDHEILVALQSITTPSSVASSPNAVQLLPSPIYVEIDTTIPHIWLPTEACRAFEVEFGLTYDYSNNIYTVNDTLHKSLLSRNANITFTLGQLTAGGQTVSIVLPYAAFDQVATAPFLNVGNSTRFFPLRQANSSAQYILGRTFMQEAYIIVDYEVSRFQLKQVVWNQSATTNLVAIPLGNASSSTTDWTSSSYKPTYSSLTSPSSTASSSSSGLSAGAIAGIVVGVVVVLALLGLLAFFFIRRRKRRAVGASTMKSDIDSSDEKTDGNDTNVFPKAELMGSTPAAFGLTHHDMDRKGLLSAYPPSSDGTYSPSSAGFPHTPAGEGTMSSAYSNSPFPVSPMVEAHSRAIYEMPGDMPNREKDGKELSEKEALQHRERVYNGIDEAIESSSMDGAHSPNTAAAREARRVEADDVVNAQTGDPMGRHRAFSFEFSPSERDNLTTGSGSTLVQHSPTSPSNSQERTLI
ncbi:hypothetical protein AMS68_005530 [Peltaster fructicola]|uniref:Peptidase A1 domain-containing protein n=1 Tax=Peltaster fructicola TaxID=286661 RepID=A0A6H0XZ28_9PEZI|nr:hypothetical protein AMS68_005530 [Peltaster fructicola]